MEYPITIQKILYKIFVRLHVYIVPFISILLLVSITFILAYLIGRADGITSAAPVTMMPTLTDTPVNFKADFEITPAPPDTSGWNDFTGYMHYHIYTIKLPASFTDTTPDSSTPGMYEFTSTNGDKLTLTVSLHAPIKPRYTLSSGLTEAYSQTIKGTDVEEKATVDFFQENLSATYSGTTQTPYFLFRSIMNTINYSTSAPDFADPYKSLSMDNIWIEYPGEYIPDTLDANTKNCNGEKETIINFADPRLYPLITLEFNPCPNTKSFGIKTAKMIKINNAMYALATFNDGQVCIVNPNDKNLKDLALLPISKWPFAPIQTTFDGVNVSFCITTKSQTQDTLNEFIKLIGSIKINY